MAKRFSARETALLMLPVLAVGALGLWLSKRAPAPDAARSVGPVHFKFHLEAPTTLEAFDGADAVVRVEVRNDDEKNWYLQNYQPYLEWETPGGEVSRNYSFVLSSTTVMHTPVREPVAYQLDLRWSGSMKDVPAGKLRFGLDYVVGPTPSNKTVMLTPPKAFRAAEKWKIDRAKIKPINLRKLPRQPLISLHEVKIIGLTQGDDGN